MHLRILSVLFALATCSAPLLGQSEPAGTNSIAASSGIALAPYLQALSPESAAVLWQTTQPAYGWVEYGETKELGKKQDTVVNGLRAANVTEHRVVLTGLRPGLTFWYRVCFKPITAFGPYKVDFMPEQSSEPVSFQTLPSAQQKVTTIIFNDIHIREATFTALRKVVGDTPFDFSIFNGDCFDNPTNRTATQNMLAFFNRGVAADRRPAFYVRGNHDDRGAFARDFPSLLAWPDDRPYFAFNAGPARFVILDCGEDKPDDHREYSGLNDFSGFRREETEWLKKEVGSEPFRKATWRVLVAHIPLYRASNERDASNYSDVCQQLWGDILANADVDLAINGHTHRMAFHPANTVGAPYPIAIGGGPSLNAATVMILDADNHELKLRMLNAEGREAFPTFEKRKPAD